MIAYSISSHVMYSPLTLPILLPSMIESGIPNSLIHVWVCGANAKATLVTKCGILHFVTHQSRGFTAFIEPVQEKFGYNWWFLMNDTMKVGPLFGQLSQQLDETKDCIAASTLAKAPYPMPDRCQTDLGAYKQSFLNSQKEWILQFINVSEVKNAKHEGELYSRCPPEKRGIYGSGDYVRTEFPVDIYGAGIKRLVEYYPALDMYKYKSNWGLDEHNEKP
jgi:hypothetical protein